VFHHHIGTWEEATFDNHDGDLCVTLRPWHLAGQATLHVIKPEYDPSWRLISEYAIRPYGWVMALVFLALALSCVTVVVAIRSQVRTLGGVIGLVCLLVAATGMTIAAIFTTDPITASKDALTTHGNLHGLGALLGIPTFPIAATLMSRSLVRNRTWSSARRPLRWTVGFIWVSFLAFIVTMAVLFRGTFGPDVVIGWPNAS
jgi:hypothetical protein